MRALDRKLLRELRRLRGQLIAVAAVVCCGVAVFVAMRSSYGALLATRDAYYAEYRFADVFAHVKRAPRGAAERLGEVPGVARVEARVVADVALDVPGLEEPGTGRLVSLPAGGGPALNRVFLARGAFPERSRPDDVVVSRAFAEANGLGLGDSFAAILNGRRRRLTVCGTGLSPEYVYEIRGAGSMLPDTRRFGVMWMGEEALAAAFDLTGAFNDVSLSLAPGASEQEVIARVDDALGRYGGLGAHGREDQVSARFLADEIRGQRASGFYSPLVFLAVALFLLHLVLSRLVGAQREQIGLLKAFGYGPAAIGWHYAELALAAALAGSAAGLPLGLWLGWRLFLLHVEYYHFPVVLFGTNAGELGAGAGLAALVACLGAVSAVRRAAALPPAEAMRPAPPASFRPLLLERAGLRALLSPASRMLLRNIERRPLRAAMSLVAIALAVALVVLGRSVYSAVDAMATVQFQDVERADVTVVLDEPRDPGALSAVRHLPGVLAAEPFRAVPVELSKGHRSRRVAVMGLAPGGGLRRVVGMDRRRVGVPEHGLLLTARLAELLGAAPGDVLRVEVREGDRRVRDATVTALVEEPMGLNAYMDLGALSRLLGDEGAVSGAFLETDPALEPELCRELKRIPAVAGVRRRAVELESFQEVISRNNRISNTAVLIFAVVIAAAVVYNGLRVALSERQHELASLRVLGFTVSEVAALLIREQAILTLAAMPVGFALGWALAAWLASEVESDLMRLPIAGDPGGFAAAFLVVAGASLLSSLAVLRRVRGLDMVEALKVGE